MKQGSRMRWINSGGGDEELDKVSEASVAYATTAGTADLSNRTKLYLNGTHVTDPDFYAPTGSGTDGQHLRSNGANKDPTWEYPIVTQLNGDNTSHDREIYAPSAVGEEYQVLESTGEGEPKWRDPMVAKINGYGPLYGRANDIYVFQSKGQDGQIAYGGGSRPTWGDPIIATVNGGSGHLSKQIWAPESAGESGQILQSRGSGDPRWVDRKYFHEIIFFISTSSTVYTFLGIGSIGFVLVSSYQDLSQPSSLVEAWDDEIGCGEEFTIPVTVTSAKYTSMFKEKEGSTYFDLYNGYGDRNGARYSFSLSYELELISDLSIEL